MMHLLLAIAAHLGCDVHSMDVVTMFLNSQIDKWVYVNQFERYDSLSLPCSGLVLKLKQAFYAQNSHPSSDI